MHQHGILYLLTRVSRLTHSSMLHFFPHDYWQNPLDKGHTSHPGWEGFIKVNMFFFVLD